MKGGNPPKAMTAKQLSVARRRLGMTQAELANALRVGHDRTVRRWELGQIPVPGPVEVLIQLWLEQQSEKKR